MHQYNGEVVGRTSGLDDSRSGDSHPAHRTVWHRFFVLQVSAYEWSGFAPAWPCTRAWIISGSTCLWTTLPEQLQRRWALCWFLPRPVHLKVSSLLPRLATCFWRQGRAGDVMVSGRSANVVSAITMTVDPTLSIMTQSNRQAPGDTSCILDVLTSGLSLMSIRSVRDGFTESGSSASAVKPTIVCFSSTAQRWWHRDFGV